jgi:hypothetical protein
VNPHQSGDSRVVEKAEADAMSTQLVCAGCGSVVVGEDAEAARGLAWLHMQDCQDEGVL